VRTTINQKKLSVIGVLATARDPSSGHGLSRMWLACLPALESRGAIVSAARISEYFGR
jgi:hypothetical protein